VMIPPTFDVVVVGAIGIDTNVYAQAESIDATVETQCGRASLTARATCI